MFQWLPFNHFKGKYNQVGTTMESEAQAMAAGQCDQHKRPAESTQLHIAPVREGQQQEPGWWTPETLYNAKRLIPEQAVVLDSPRTSDPSQMLELRLPGWG